MGATAKASRENEIKNIEDLISIKGIKAIGNQLSSFKIKNIDQLDPIEYSPPEKQTLSEMEVESEEILVKNDEKKLNDISKNHPELIKEFEVKFKQSHSTPILKEFIIPNLEL